MVRMEGMEPTEIMAGRVAMGMVDKGVIEVIMLDTAGTHVEEEAGLGPQKQEEVGEEGTGEVDTLLREEWIIVLDPHSKGIHSPVKVVPLGLDSKVPSVPHKACLVHTPTRCQASTRKDIADIDLHLIIMRHHDFASFR